MPGHRVFAALYDRFVIGGPEKAGLREMRAELLAGARGRVLELGAGTGLNLAHYGEEVTELALTEPDPHMAKRLRARAAEIQTPSQVVEAGAEQLPFDDHSFDTVVATLVLCTVDDPNRVVAEVARLLKADGQLLLIEHVRDAEGSRRARWQDRLQPPWTWIGAGCHPNRDTGTTLSASFDTAGLQADQMPGSGTALVKPLIRGTVRPLSAA
jgi:ubiquinone/menaquinone biosynthesis C-methylase UbiE